MKKKIIFNKPLINYEAKKNILDVLKKKILQMVFIKKNVKLLLKKK